VVRALQWIIYAEKPLSTPALLEALAVEDGDVDIDRSAMTTEEEVLHWASSLIRKSVVGGLEIAHFTVKEFLMSINPSETPQYSPYSVADSKEVHIQLARTCLAFLNSKTFFSNIEPTDVLDVIKSHLFLDYAAAYWDYHAILDLNDASISLLMRQLFHPATNGQFRLYRLAHYALTFTLTVDSHFDDSTPLHWAACLGLPDLCAWLIGQGLAADQMSSTMGTPLNCALLGDMALDMCSEQDILDSASSHVRPANRPRAQVVQIFFDVDVPTNVITSPMLDLSPLFLAVLSEDSAICSALIAAGAQFSNYDLWVTANQGMLSHVADWVIKQAFADMRVVPPDAYETLFALAIRGIIFLGCPAAETAGRLLLDLSSLPEALEWASKPDLSEADYQDLLHFYPLLKGMQCTLQSSENFPSCLRNLAIEAVKNCDRTITSLILDTDADALSLLKDAEDNGAFHLPLRGYKDPDSYVTRQDCLKMVELLVRTGHHVNQRNSQGETPLHLAAEYDEVEVFKMLLGGNSAEEALDIQTNTGLSAYDCAVEARSPAIVELISSTEKVL
jgi:ankyrin repeat protein